MFMNMVVVNVFAYDIEVENADGKTIYYNYINDGKELEVTNGQVAYDQFNIPAVYFGDIVIPEEVTYMSRTRKVTAIGKSAFFTTTSRELLIEYNLELKSVTIPNSVTTIGDEAFMNSWFLTSVNIPDNVTSIGMNAFAYCKELPMITIPNSVKSIGDGAFSGCDKLSSVNITDLAAWCNIDFKDNPLAHAHHLYLNDEEIKDLVIPDGVTSIGNLSFYRCSGLTSVTIPNSVTSIGKSAFYGDDLPFVVSLIENPFEIVGKDDDYKKTFSSHTFNNATLYVPVGTKDKYMATKGWKDFLFIEEGTGPNGGGGDTPGTQKCAKPTISYQKGKLFFNCDTEGATCQSTITDTDIASYSSNEVQLGVTYHISVYATKAGYDNSETATATLCWIDVDPKTEGITNAVANVRALPVLIQTNGSTLTISGADNGTPINVYGLNGTEAGSAIIQNGAATINTTLQSGSIAIVKVGTKSVKVVVK